METVPLNRKTSVAETEDIYDWRRQTLERAGYDYSAAVLLARTTDVDLHLAVDLIERGCSQRTALRILL